MGQSKKYRSCPSVSREISAAECGEHRQVRYVCPEVCGFNPFAPVNYMELLTLEDTVDNMLLKRLVVEDSGAASRLLGAQKAHGAHGLHAATAWHLFFKRDKQAKTLAERWVQEGLAGLRNDGRILLRGKMQMQVVLLELRRFHDSQRFEAVDLLEPEGEPRVFIDRSVGARAMRFSTVLTWAYPLPHFWRMSGTGISMDDVGPLPGLETIDACIEHLGGPAERLHQRRWLAENFVRINEVLTATGLERRRLMFAEMDAVFVAATYELRTSYATARATLLGVPGLVEESISEEEAKEGFSQAMAWFDDQRAPGQAFADAAAGQVVLGRVLVGPKQWRVEGMGAVGVARLRAAFEARMSSQVVFVRERRDDLGARVLAKDAAPDLALVPPKLLGRTSMINLSSSRVAPPAPGVSLKDHMAAIEIEYRRTWADSLVPALGGLSPRAALAEPKWRTEVLELVKAQVRRIDQHNLESGRTDDINSLIRDLGLTELDIPPPPPRPRIPTAAAQRRVEAAGANEKTENDDQEFAPPPRQSAALRLPAPRLEGPPLTQAQARSRLERVERDFDTAAAALEELTASGATVIDDLLELTKGMLNDIEFGFLLVVAPRGWFALVPQGVRAPALDARVMEAACSALFESWRRGGPSTVGYFSRLRDACRQPALLEGLASLLVSGAKQAPKDRAPRPEVMLAMVAVLKVLLDELDLSLRRQSAI